MAAIAPHGPSKSLRRGSCCCGGAGATANFFDGCGVGALPRSVPRARAPRAVGHSRNPVRKSAATCEMAAAEPLMCPLRPQVNEHRTMLDLSGLWDFQPDAENVGEAGGFALRLPKARLAAVPGRRGFASDSQLFLSFQTPI